MTVSREEAAQALSDISKANERVVQLKGYHHGAPHFITWGLVWLFANSGSHFLPDLQKYIWPAALGAGFLASLIIGVLQSRKWPRDAGASEAERTIGARMA